MARVRVYNENVCEHVEAFKGQTICIPSKGYHEMEDEDAVLFLGQFKTPKFNKGGIQTQESKKMLRIEVINGQEKAKEQDQHVCHKCGFVAKNQAGLLAHIRANHVESMIDDDAKKEMQRGA